MEFLGQAPGVVFVKVRAHRSANNISHRGLERQVIEQICDQRPEGCEDVDESGQPTPFEKAAQFSRAMFAWVKQGCPVLDGPAYAARKAVCLDCEWWRGEGTAIGTGKCGKCGCSGLKLFLATERCPIGKWEAENK